LLLEGEKIINVDDFNDYYDLSIKITNTLDSTNNIGLRTDHIQLEKKEN
jgi:UDP-glucuronate 4-epimerase